MVKPFALPPVSAELEKLILEWAESIIEEMEKRADVVVDDDPVPTIAIYNSTGSRVARFPIISQHLDGDVLICEYDECFKPKEKSPRHSHAPKPIGRGGKQKRW